MPDTPHEGVGAFAGDAKNTAPQPAAVAGGTFKFKLALNGVPIGWLGLEGRKVSGPLWSIQKSKPRPFNGTRTVGPLIFSIPMVAI